MKILISLAKKIGLTFQKSKLFLTITRTYKYRKFFNPFIYNFLFHPIKTSFPLRLCLPNHFFEQKNQPARILSRDTGDAAAVRADPEQGDISGQDADVVVTGGEQRRLGSAGSTVLLMLLLELLFLLDRTRQPKQFRLFGLGHAFVYLSSHRILVYRCQPHRNWIFIESEEKKKNQGNYESYTGFT